MPGTNIKSNPKTDHGSVFGCWLYIFGTLFSHPNIDW
jgi:hypothetical protein